MTTDQTVTITETAPDGTETVIEITTTKADDSLDGDGQTLVEEVVEALLDENLDEVGEPASETEYSVAETSPETTEPVIADEIPVEPVESVPFEPVSFDPTTAAPESAPVTAPVDETYSSAPTIDAAETGDDSAASGNAELEAHAEAAREAQTAADEFIAEGDYAAAAEAREVAENEAYQAGDDSMLSAYDSTDLENAASEQENAEYYQQQQAQHAQEGDYEAAREDAINAGYATKDADSLAGGADHSGQAEAEEYQMDWAVWEEGNAEYNAQAAEEYLAQGDTEMAEYHAGEAAEHQEAADYHGDLGEHGGDVAVYDPSSDVSSGGSYDASTADDYSTDYSTE
jgi:hypothetical protein